MAVVITISVIVLTILYKVIKDIVKEQKRIRELQQRIDIFDERRMRRMHNREVNQYINNIKN